MEELNQLFQQTVPNVNLIVVLMNFAFCIAMSYLVKIVYVNYSVSLTGKQHIAIILPLLAAIVFLVIMIVKSSLALSLGLVGALSIVRFRTPIKEPEELVYLFLAISIGLGYAAGHTLLTTILVLSILTMIYFWSSHKKIQETNEYNLIFSLKDRTISINDVFSKVSQFTYSSKWIRSDNNSEEFSAAMLIVPRTIDDIQIITDLITELDSNAEVSFYEAKTNW